MVSMIIEKREKITKQHSTVQSEILLAAEVSVFYCAGLGGRAVCTGQSRLKTRSCAICAADVVHTPGRRTARAGATDL